MLDALEAIEPFRYAGAVWRIVGANNDVLQPSRFGGRWDDGTFDVLYTSTQSAGAVAEMRYHLFKGQPVIPSRVFYRLFEFSVSTERTLQLLDLDALVALGADVSRYARLSYERRTDEYPTTQAIGEAANFLGFDGLVVPSARASCLNVVLFADRLLPGALGTPVDNGVVDFILDPSPD